MTVDFAMGRMPAMKIATIGWKGPWNEARIRKEFRAVEEWGKRNRVRLGRWVFREPGERRWQVGIEVRGRARGSGRIRVRNLPAATVARVQFDPEVVSPRIVYHALSDWLKWRRRDHTIRSVVSTREIYPADPWKVASAWARTEVQFVVRK